MGPALGRPKKQTDENAAGQKQQHRQDALDRIAIEGKFGEGKRRYDLSRIMAKLAQTSETTIMLTFMVMNLEKMLTKALSFCARCHFAVENLLANARSRLIGDGLHLIRHRP